MKEILAKLAALEASGNDTTAAPATPNGKKNLNEYKSYNKPAGAAPEENIPDFSQWRNKVQRAFPGIEFKGDESWCTAVADERMIVGAWDGQHGNIDPQGISESFGEEEICPNCNGSGEGMYEGDRCSYCGGSGTVSADTNEPDGPEYERDLDEGELLGTLKGRAGQFEWYSKGGVDTIFKNDSPAFSGTSEEAANKFNAVKAKLTAAKNTRMGQFRAGEEQVNELSPNTLKSYVKKALNPSSEKSISNIASRSGYEYGTQGNEDPTAGGKGDAKAVNRSKGVQRAVNRLTTEDEEQVNEDWVSVIDRKIAKAQAAKKANPTAENSAALSALWKKKKELQKKHNALPNVGPARYKVESTTKEDVNNTGEVGLDEAKETDPVVLKVKDISKKFFGDPYSSARISGGTVYRLSININGLMKPRQGPYGMTQGYRYSRFDLMIPEDKQTLIDLKEQFKEAVKQNGIDPSLVDVKYHMGAGVYASVRIKIGSGFKVSESGDEQQVNELSPKTLGSYVKKASKDAKSRGYDAGAADWSGDEMHKHPESRTWPGRGQDAKAHKRLKGIDRAVDRLTNESSTGDIADQKQKKLNDLEQKLKLSNYTRSKDESGGEYQYKWTKEGKPTYVVNYRFGPKGYAAYWKEPKITDEAIATDKQHKDVMDKMFNDPNTVQTMKNLKRRDQDPKFDQEQKDKFVKSLQSKKNTTENKHMTSTKIVLEGQSFSVSSPSLAKVLRHFPKEVSDFNMGADLDDHLYNALYDHWFDEMPYGTRKARDGDPYEWVSEKLQTELGNNDSLRHPADRAIATAEGAAGDIMALESEDEHFACVYCGKEVPPGVEPTMFNCCGEVGHVEPIDDLEEALSPEQMRAAQMRSQQRMAGVNPYAKQAPSNPFAGDEKRNAGQEQSWRAQAGATALGDSFDPSLDEEDSPTVAAAKKRAAERLAIQKRINQGENPGWAGSPQDLEQQRKNAIAAGQGSHRPADYQSADIDSDDMIEEDDMNEAFLVEENEELITSVLEDMGLDHGLDFFFDGGLVAIGRSTAKVIISALKNDPRVRGTPSITSIDGEEVQIGFDAASKQVPSKVPSIDDFPDADFDVNDGNPAPMRGESLGEDVGSENIDWSSLQVDGVNDLDRPDYSDAYFSYGEHTDGTPLSDEELDALTDSHGDIVNQKANSMSIGRGANRADYNRGMSESKQTFDTYAEADKHFTALAHKTGESAADKYAEGDSGRYSAFVKKHVKPKVNEDVTLKIRATGDDDVINLIRKLSGINGDSASMPAQSAQSAMPDMAAMMTTIDSAEHEVEPEDNNRIDIVATGHDDDFGDDDMDESEYANEPDPTVHTSTTQMINQGNDLNRPKKSYPRVSPGDNPMAEARNLMKEYEAMKISIKK